MVKRIGTALLLGYFGVSLLVLAILMGAAQGIECLLPVVHVIRSTFDWLNYGILSTAAVALLGLWFVIKACKAPFTPKPEK